MLIRGIMFAFYKRKNIEKPHENYPSDRKKKCTSFNDTVPFI